VAWEQAEQSGGQPLTRVTGASGARGRRQHALVALRVGHRQRRVPVTEIELAHLTAAYGVAFLGRVEQFLGQAEDRFGDRSAFLFVVDSKDSAASFQPRLS
jgi:hypothetical protein